MSTYLNPQRNTTSNRLDLRAGLKEFPREIFELADTLEILDISGNQFTTLPDDFDRLHKLRILFCSDNPFTELPEVLGRCKSLSMVGFRNNRIARVSPLSLPPHLRWLILTGNLLEELPAELGRRPLLQKLMVAGNRLKSLPVEMAACKNLELLRIAANQFEALPEWLLDMPRLSWLSYSGNPFCAEREARALVDAPVALVPWDCLALKHKLGEGASGVIYQGSIKRGAMLRTESGANEETEGVGVVCTEAGQDGDTELSADVAIKLFKGELTSDGLPYSEMAACMRAGAHPNLITVKGKIDSHPEGQAGLVMSLVGSHYRNLAGPPSLESCTRDVYAPEMQFNLSEALRIALDMASVAEQLHANGIMHGDFYAHNILVNESGHALLGDFGAACFVSETDAAQALGLERIEVRAFGCLLEELLERVGVPKGGLLSVDVLHQARQLKESCLDNSVNTRPGFKQLKTQLFDLLSCLVACR
jgi:hypothetical protein